MGVTREGALFTVLAIGAVLLTLAWIGWRGRLKRGSSIILPDRRRPAGTPLESFSVLYVATTEADKPLERVAVRPLAYRAKAVLELFDDAIVMVIHGEGHVVLSWHDVVGVGRATWTIDRVVDSDGLVYLRWETATVRLDSYFRPVDFSADTLSESLRQRHQRVAGEDSQ